MQINAVSNLLHGAVCHRNLDNVRVPTGGRPHAVSPPIVGDSTRGAVGRDDCVETREVGFADAPHLARPNVVAPKNSNARSIVPLAVELQRSRPTRGIPRSIIIGVGVADYGHIGNVVPNVVIAKPPFGQCKRVARAVSDILEIYRIDLKWPIFHNVTDTVRFPTRVSARPITGVTMARVAEADLIAVVPE